MLWGAITLFFSGSHRTARPNAHTHTHAKQTVNQSNSEKGEKKETEGSPEYKNRF